VAEPARPPDHWFEPLADHLGSAYLRYSFTKGTANELAFLVGALGLTPGQRILDVGCGPGRHSNGLAELGYEVVGVDISARFVELARAAAHPGATFHRMDARALAFDAEFDAAISLCQGAFGLAGHGGGPEPMRVAPAAVADPDGQILARMARAVRPGGRVAVSAFSSYFQIRYLEDSDAFDVERGVNHERSVLKDADGVEATHDLWTSCFTPRELRLMAEAAGLAPEHLWSVTPGAYAANPPDLDHPEFLLLARR
jgi:SAM-dependent methyltransferase